MLLWEKSAHEAALREYSITMAHPYYTATIQPPVVARAAARIFDATGDLGFVHEVLPPILRFFGWLKANRDPDGDDLVAIIQPDESGLDASPKYDRRMRISHERPAETLQQLQHSMQRLFDSYASHRADAAALLALDVFRWEDVMVNVIYADGLRALAALCSAARYPVSEVRELDQRASRVLRVLVEKCWDVREGVFWDLDGRAEERSRVLTFSSLFPLVLPDLEPGIASRLIDEHLLNEREFWLRYPVPSVAASEPSFDPGWTTRTTWRGPTWINVNWYFYWALRAHGRRDVASELAERTLAMVTKSGIREFYDPRNADGQGAVDFGWSCLVLDLIAAEGRPLD
jgi:glycogen debranching enzyme